MYPSPEGTWYWAYSSLPQGTLDQAYSHRKGIVPSEEHALGVYQEYPPTPRRNLGLGIHPPPNRHTVNENITFPQLDWRPVINIHINWGRNSNSHHFQINAPGVMSQLQFTKPMLYPLHVRYEVVNLQGGTWKMVMG